MAARVYDEVFGYIEDATKTLPGAAAPGELPGELPEQRRRCRSNISHFTPQAYSNDYLTSKEYRQIKSNGAPLKPISNKHASRVPTELQKRSSAISDAILHFKSNFFTFLLSPLYQLLSVTILIYRLSYIYIYIYAIPIFVFFSVFNNRCTSPTSFSRITNKISKPFLGRSQLPRLPDQCGL